MLIWMLVSLSVLNPVNFDGLGSFKFVYFICVFVFYVYSWIYFYRRPRGSKTLLDGRTALSVSAFILGGATGYALIDFGFIASRNVSELATGSFAIFVGCTVLPIMAWLAVYISTLRRKNAALRSGVDS
jgi:uncharacterized membrane protein